MDIFLLIYLVCILFNLAQMMFVAYYDYLRIGLFEMTIGDMLLFLLNIAISPISVLPIFIFIVSKLSHVKLIVIKREIKR